MIIAAERQNLAVELRKAGLSYQKIGNQLGISRQSAFKAVRKALREIEADTAESASELVRIELERLDDYQIRVTQEIKSGQALAAIDRGIRIMNRRAKLLGLDAPAKVVTETFDHQQQIDELWRAVDAGDESALDALERIARGEGFMSVYHLWKQTASLVVSASDTAKMTREELAKAAQGKLTFQELAQIRERPGDDEVEKEAQ